MTFKATLPTCLYITPPDLILERSDKNILILGNTNLFSDKCIDLIEPIFQADTISFFFAKTEIDYGVLTWMRYVSFAVDLLIINIDGATQDEILLSMLVEMRSDTSVILYSEDTKSTTNSILKSFSISPISSIEELGEEIEKMFEIDDEDE